MKRRNLWLIAFLLTKAVHCYSIENNCVLYVSPKGDDRNIGTVSHPLRTIKTALERAGSESRGGTPFGNV